MHSRTPAWVAVATLVHAAALALLMVAPLRRSGAGTVSPPTERAEIAITLEGEPQLTAESPAPPATSALASAEPSATPERSTTRIAGAAVAGAPRSEPVREAITAPAGAENRPSGAPGAAPSGSGIAIPIPYSDAELGIGGPNPFLPRREEKAPTGGPDHPAARAMRGTGLARDRELGLGPEGPAIAALTEATTSSIAPLRGRAMFVVRTGGDGVVSAIDLVDSEGGSGWVDAGRIALERLRGKKLRIPSGATGMNMHIEVRSEMKLPNGENAPFGGRLGENDMPELTIPDVSNIGSKPRRVVHARAAGTELL